jgi:SCY1-like protein 2
MAALDVFVAIGKIVDVEFLATDILPVIWTFSLGPLLNLEQFRSFMSHIRTVSTRIEQDHTRKLQELSSSNATSAANRNDFMSFGAPAGSLSLDDGRNGDGGDFEALVLGKSQANNPSVTNIDPWASSTPSSQLPYRPTANTSSSAAAAAFSWSTPPLAPGVSQSNASAGSSFRTVSPDQSMNSIGTLQPTSRPIDWASAAASTNNAWSTNNGVSHAKPSNTSSAWRPTPIPPTMGAMNSGWSQPQMGASSLAAASPSSPYSNFSITPPPLRTPNAAPSSIGSSNTSSFRPATQPAPQTSTTASRQGLDKYESLL